jgi:hypothetical protein
MTICFITVTVYCIIFLIVSNCTIYYVCIVFNVCSVVLHGTQSQKTSLIDTALKTSQKTVVFE